MRGRLWSAVGVGSDERERPGGGSRLVLLCAPVGAAIFA